LWELALSSQEDASADDGGISQSEAQEFSHHPDPDDGFRFSGAHFSELLAAFASGGTIE
jgi:hypothetical protein